MRAIKAEISTGALTRNLIEVRRRAPDKKVLAVVKADGYGHGLERVAKALSGADAFGVASLDDAERLRALGLNQRIVLLSGFDEPADLPIIRSLKLDCVLHDPHQLRILQLDHGKESIRCWLKFDTGMRRLGFAVAELEQIVAACQAMPSIDPELTLMTHFASSDEPDLATTAKQIAQFDHYRLAAEQGLLPVSMANSAAVVAHEHAHRAWVRPGGVLYGLSTFTDKTGAELGFEPVMRLSSKLIACKRIQAGDAVGYGGAFIADKPMRIGIVAAGYGDGYPRHASLSATPVIVAGRRTHTIGRISMDLMAVDITEIADADVGSDVLLWGAELPVEHIARSAGTISYELTCGLTRRVRFAEV